MEQKIPLAEENLGLVRLCAGKFTNRGIEYDDLYGAGCVGLVKATKSFDVTRGVKFSTYAVPVILGEIKRLFRDGGSVSVSRSIKELAMKISAFREKFYTANGREPTISQICHQFNESEENVSLALNSTLSPVSLTAFDDNDEYCGEIDIPDNDPVESIVDRLTLQNALEKLDKDDRTLIYLRYFDSRTQCETAKILNTTQVQISRREKKILARLRQMLE